MKIRNSGGAGVLSPTLKVYQNSRSNRLLNWIHDTLVASGQYWCTPVADLLLSLFIMHNCVQQQDKSGYLDGKKRYRPKLDIPVNLNELAQQVYPKGCQATAIGRSRTAWANRFSLRLALSFVNQELSFTASTWTLKQESLSLGICTTLVSGAT